MLYYLVYIWRDGTIVQLFWLPLSSCLNLKGWNYSPDLIVNVLSSCLNMKGWNYSPDLFVCFIVLLTVCMYICRDGTIVQLGGVMEPHSIQQFALFGLVILLCATKNKNISCWNSVLDICTKNEYSSNILCRKRKSFHSKCTVAKYYFCNNNCS